ncbi:hypothetical protein MNBD_GAMMA18-1762 [hydrothermal vent metagenome]|uniref:DUF2971 domain-containing protein n=1 Tax=hydrothermal vent metagenome TaxID=652676 RepID=A0A3B0ZQW4_9ZZZZ
MTTSTSLFKYRKFDKRSIELLVNRQLWFAKPASLNDPFEGKSSCSEVLEAVWSHYPFPEEERKQYKTIIETQLQNSGICSFSKTRKNQLMWSHYADEHKGICIGFNEQILRPDNSSIYPIDVTYQAEYPFAGIIERFKYFEELPGVNNTKSIAGDIFYSVLGTKYLNWEYERERRLVYQKSQAISFTEKAVNSIFFGLKMPERDRLTLRKLLSGEEWQHIKWYQAIKSKTEYALVFQEI